MTNLTNDLSTTSHTPSRSRRLRMAFLLGSLSAFGPLSLDMYLPSLPGLATDLHTSTSLSQFSLTSCLLGLALGQLVAGPISDVRGRRLPLLAGLILYAISSLFCAFSSSIWILIVLRFVQGTAGSAGIVISRAVVRDLYSGPELTKFYALLMLVNGAAPILAPIAGGQLLQVTTWHGVFIVLSLIGMLMFLAVLFGLPETLPGNNRSKGGIRHTLSTFRGLVSDRVFMGYALSQGLVAAAMFAYISGSPFVTQELYGVSPQLFSLIFATNGLGIILAGQLAGRLAGRVNGNKLFVAGVVSAAVSGIILLLLILIRAKLFAILPPLFVVVSCVGIVSASGFALAMQNYGKSAGSASALLGLLSFILGAIVSPLVGIAGGHTAVPMGVVIAMAETLSICFYLILARNNVQ